MVACTFTAINVCPAAGLERWHESAGALRRPANSGRLVRFGKVMARKKISTTIYITPEQNDRLKLLHERTKVPVAVYIREGIDLVLDRHQSELPGQLQLAAANDKK